MILKAEKISKEFPRQMKNANRFTAVQETDFRLNPGELVIIMGRSGSGKSTLLNMFAGLLQPTAGKIFLDDKSLYDLEDQELSKLRNQHIGMIPQGQTALYSLTMLENICLPYTLYGEEPHEADACALLDRLEISHLRNAMPSELSGGELRRMAIARAMMKKPGILLADEPTSDLDDETTKIVFSFLKESAHNGTAVLIVTHENDAKNYADRSFRMNAGMLCQD